MTRHRRAGIAAADNPDPGPHAPHPFLTPCYRSAPSRSGAQLSILPGGSLGLAASCDHCRSRANHAVGGCRFNFAGEFVILTGDNSLSSISNVIALPAIRAKAIACRKCGPSRRAFAPAVVT